jgi:hypothetical protein
MSLTESASSIVQKEDVVTSSRHDKSMSYIWIMPDPLHHIYGKRWDKKNWRLLDVRWRLINLSWNSP